MIMSLAFNSGPHTVSPLSLHGWWSCPAGQVKWAETATKLPWAVHPHRAPSPAILLTQLSALKHHFIRVFFIFLYNKCIQWLGGQVWEKIKDGLVCLKLFQSFVSFLYRWNRTAALNPGRLGRQKMLLLLQDSLLNPGSWLACIGKGFCVLPFWLRTFEAVAPCDFPGCRSGSDVSPVGGKNQQGPPTKVGTLWYASCRLSPLLHVWFRQTRHRIMTARLDLQQGCREVPMRSGTNAISNVMIPLWISGRTAVVHHKWTCSYADTVICNQCCKSFALRSSCVQSQIRRGKNIFPRLWRKSPGSQRDLELGTWARSLYFHLKSYTFVSLSMYSLGVGGVTPTESGKQMPLFHPFCSLF